MPVLYRESAVPKRLKNDPCIQTDVAEWTRGKRSTRTLSTVQGVDRHLKH